MADVVVTVPKRLWTEWLDEGTLPGEEWNGYEEFGFLIHGGTSPTIAPGERVYVVAHGMLRGYSPLVEIDCDAERFGGRPSQFALVRRAGAVAVTIPEPITGFRGWRYRWWPREAEVPFPDWRTQGVG